jgi:hypothetical protein
MASRAPQYDRERRAALFGNDEASEEIERVARLR